MSVTRGSDVNVAKVSTSAAEMESDDASMGPLYLLTSVEDNTTLAPELPGATTRGYRSDTLVAGVSFGWFAADHTSTVYSNQEATQSSDKYTYTTGVYWPTDLLTTSQTYNFYAYYPYINTPVNGLSIDAATKTITYDASSVSPSKQQDLMTAHVVAGYNGGAAVPLLFKHACTAVVIRVAANLTSEYRVKNVTFENIVTGGTCTLTHSAAGHIWNAITKSAADTVYNNSTGYPGSSQEKTITGLGGGSSLMMIPQSFTSADQRMRITMNYGGEDHVLAATLNGSEWESGKVVVYTISKSSIAALTSLTVDYPVWKDGSDNGVRGPVSRYDNDDTFGLFRIDNATNKIDISNRRVHLSFSSTTSTCDLSAIEEMPSEGYTYYLMYPYKSSGIPAALAVDASMDASSTADQFFSSVISGWTVSNTQNTFATHKAQDLQIAKVSIAGTSAHAAMVHKMGLAKITLGTTSITANNVRTYTTQSGTHDYYTTTSTTTDVTATSQLDATSQSRLLDADGGFWTIVKATGVSTNTSVTLNSVDSDTDADAWTSAVTVADIGYGRYKNTVVYSRRDDAESLVANFEYNTNKSYYQISLEPGLYRLEVWGAQGGDGRRWNTDTRIVGVGGKGGYTNGTLNLTETTTLYVCVGGQGEWAVTERSPISAGYNPQGGYNGGGDGGTESGEAPHPENAAAGGGATHIATSLQGIGVLSEYLDHKEDVLIVAGGGGGAAGDFPGNYSNVDAETVTTTGDMDGYGLEDNPRASLQAYFGGHGGSTGAGTTYHYGHSSVTKYICGVIPCSCPGVADDGDDAYFGQGQMGATHLTGNIGGTGGGGGGWYGGTYGGNHKNPVSAGGAGGSGHVKTSGTHALTNYGGIVGVRTGDGFARITKIGSAIPSPL